MQILVVKDIEQGLERAKEELYKLVDSKTVLFLSGGTTPGPLYKTLAEEGIIKPAAVAMIDERFGPKMHENSNEKMIDDSKLLKYLKLLNIPFYPILQEGLTREETAKNYDQKVRDLFFHFPKSVAIMGVGIDGHTAGIPASLVISTLSEVEGEKSHDGISRSTRDDKFSGYDFVTSYNDESGKYGQRVTLTFAGLALIDHFLVFAFGKERSQALKKAFLPGPLEEVPARFYLTDEISKKTLLITDQKI